MRVPATDAVFHGQAPASPSLALVVDRYFHPEWLHGADHVRNLPLDFQFPQAGDHHSPMQQPGAEQHPGQDDQEVHFPHHCSSDNKQDDEQEVPALRCHGDISSPEHAIAPWA